MPRPVSATLTEIRVGGGQVRRNGRLDPYAGARRAVSERERGVKRERADVDRLPMERERAGFRERERAKVLDEPGENLGLLEDRAQVRLVGWMDAVDERFELALHDRERRAQLMAHVRENAAALLLERGEARGHRVERPSERARCARSSLPHARAEITLGDPLDRVDHVRDGSGETAERPRGEPERHEDEEEERAASDAAREVGRAERGREEPEDERRGDHREDDRDEEKRDDVAHESATRPPGPPAPPPTRRGEGLVFRPPGRPSAPAVPAAAHSCSAKRYPTP